MFCKASSSKASLTEPPVYKATRIMALIQLCLVFTVLAWDLSYPFMGELFSYRAKLLVYHEVMGLSPTNKKLNEEATSHLQKNAARFEKLPSDHKERILLGHNAVRKQSEKSFWEKLKLSFQILVYELPAWEQAWIFFSIAICLLLLLGVEGAVPTVWLLPLITLCYVWGNQSIGLQIMNQGEYALYPKEEVLVRSYLKRPLSPNILVQQTELKEAWENYLIVMWAKEKPARDAWERKNQIEKGQFYFQLKRLELLDLDQKHQLDFFFNKRQSFVVLALYFCWNLFFALRVSWLAIKDMDACPVGSWVRVR